MKQPHTPDNLFAQRGHGTADQPTKIGGSISQRNDMKRGGLQGDNGWEDGVAVLERNSRIISSGDLPLSSIATIFPSPLPTPISMPSTLPWASQAIWASSRFHSVISIFKTSELLASKNSRNMSYRALESVLMSIGTSGVYGGVQLAQGVLVAEKAGEDAVLVFLVRAHVG